MSAQKRSETIAAGLREQIIRGAFSAGDRLPPERELARRLEANRGSVREALKILEQQGLVAIRRGDGTSVRPLHEASIELLPHLLRANGRMDRDLIDQLVDSVEMYVVGAVYLATERATDEQLARVRRAISGLGEASGPEDYNRAATALGDLISEVNDNLVLRLIRNALIPGLRESAFTLYPQIESDRLGYAQRVAAVDHALGTRDAAAAAEAVRKLIRQSREYLNKALDTPAA